MVELDVVDLICCLGLEPSQNDVVLLLGYLHAEVVEDGAEAGEGDEARSAPVLVLEVGLNQEASVLHLSTKSLQSRDQDLLLLSVKHVLGVEDRGGIERVGAGRWVLLQGFIREDGVQFVTESHIVNESGIVGKGIVLFKSLELNGRERDSLRMKGASVFLAGQVSLSQSVVVLEKLEKSDSIALHNLLDLCHEGIMCLLTVKVSESVLVGRLGSSGVPVDYVLEAVSVTQEVHIPNCVIFVAVDKSHSIHIFLFNEEAKGVEDLAEDLGTDFKGAQRVSVLEEGLGVETVLSDHLAEIINDVHHHVALFLSGLTTAVDRVGTDLTNWGVNGLF